VEFQEVVRRRRMVRNFEKRPVPAEAVDRILANAIRAPSAGFTQGWSFLVLEDSADRERFWEVAWPVAERHDSERLDVMKAPLIVVPLASKDAYLDRYAEPDKGWKDRDEAHWPVPYWDVDASFASLLMLLTAVDQGLGALFFGIAHPESVREPFGIPVVWRPIGAIAIGYAAPDVPSPSLKRGRRGVGQVVHRGRW
jgi:nitroreductase